MTETNEGEETKTSLTPTTTTNTNEGGESQTLDVIKQANQAREGLEQENARLEKNIARLAELKAIDTLSGTTNAGQQEGKKEENPKAYAERVLSGKVQ